MSAMPRKQKSGSADRSPAIEPLLMPVVHALIAGARRSREPRDRRFRRKTCGCGRAARRRSAFTSVTPEVRSIASSPTRVVRPLSDAQKAALREEGPPAIRPRRWRRW